MNLQDVENLIRPNIVKMKPYVCARHNTSTGVLLNANENPYGKYNRYPDPMAGDLKNALSKFLNVAPEMTMATNGSDEAIDLIMRMFGQPGKDSILILEPTFGMYQLYAEINDLAVESVMLDENFQIDLSAVLKKIEEQPEIKIIFFCSPNNPTGNCMRSEDILTICEKFSGVVVVDEAYVEFSDQESLVGGIDQYSNLIVLRTLSKAWAAASLRIGYMVAQKEIITNFYRIKPPYDIGGENQRIAIELLRGEMKTKEILENKKKLKDDLESMGLKIYPSDSNFFLMQIPQAQKIYTRLVEKGIIVRDRSDQIKDCLRITIGDKAECELLTSSLKEILKKVAFIDRDGVILFEPQDDFQVDSLEKYKMLPGVVEGLKKLQNAGYSLVMVSNQNGIGTPSFPEENFLIPHNKMIADLASGGVAFEEIFVCPHFATDGCECRKPKTGLIKKYLEKNPIDYSASFVIGDRMTDVELAENIGVKGYKIDTNSDGLLQTINKLLP